jgi:hypothetical protein
MGLVRFRRILALRVECGCRIRPEFAHLPDASRVEIDQLHLLLRCHGFCGCSNSPIRMLDSWTLLVFL